MSDVADTPRCGEDGRDRVLELRSHLEQALVALDQLRELLPESTPPDQGSSG